MNICLMMMSSFGAAVGGDDDDDGAKAKTPEETYSEISADIASRLPELFVGGLGRPRERSGALSSVPVRHKRMGKTEARGNRATRRNTTENRRL